jgi:hypothetical protein
VPPWQDLFLLCNIFLYSKNNNNNNVVVEKILVSSACEKCCVYSDRKIEIIDCTHQGMMIQKKKKKLSSPN